MKGLYLFLSALLVSSLAFGQVNSIASGDWSTPANWSCTCVPSVANGTVTISALDVITMTTGSHQITALFIDGDGTLNLNGGSLIVNGNLDVTIGDGFSTVDGFLNLNSGGSLEGRGLVTSSTGNTQINGSYIHNQNGGAIPTASWNTGSSSTVQVRCV